MRPTLAAPDWLVSNVNTKFETCSALSLPEPTANQQISHWRTEINRSSIIWMFTFRVRSRNMHASQCAWRTATVCVCECVSFHSIMFHFQYRFRFCGLCAPCADVVCNFHYDLCCSLFDSTITSIEIDQIKSCMCPIPFHSSIPMCAQHARLANVPLVAGSSRRSIDQSSMQLSFSFSNRIAKRDEAICALLLWVARIAAVGGNKYACLFGVSGRWNLEEEFSYGKNRSMAHNLITDKHKTISNWQRELPLLEYFILWQTRALSLSRPLSRDVRCDALER